jgi:hypothetical protein
VTPRRAPGSHLLPRERVHAQPGRHQLWGVGLEGVHEAERAAAIVGSRSSALGRCFVGEKSPLGREALECVLTAILEDKP